jgi:hypothetical protein
MINKFTVSYIGVRNFHVKWNVPVIFRTGVKQNEFFKFLKKTRKTRKMLSGPAAITGQLPGRSSYNSSIDTEAYGKKLSRKIFMSMCHLKTVRAQSFRSVKTKLSLK